MSEPKWAIDLLAACKELQKIDLGINLLPMRPAHVPMAKWRKLNTALAAIDAAIDAADAKATEEPD